MASKRLQNHKSDVTGRNPDVLRVADTQIDVADIQASNSQDAEMVKRDEAARGFAGHHSDEPQQHITERQGLQWDWKLLLCAHRRHRVESGIIPTV